MAKKVTGYIKLQIPAGKATPAPPVGPALGQHGVNIVQFTKEFNAKNSRSGRYDHPGCYHSICGQKLQLHHKDSAGCSFIKEGLQLKCGSGVPNKTKVATISRRLRSRRSQRSRCQT